MVEVSAMTFEQLKRYLSCRRLDPWAENVVPTSLGCNSFASLDSVQQIHTNTWEMYLSDT